MSPLAKPVMWAIWIASVVAMLFGTGWIATAGQLTFGVTLLAHVAEFFANRALFERAGGSMSHHFVQTLMYGLIHWVPIKQRLADSQE